MLSDTLISHPPCGWLTLVLDPRSLGEARFFTYMEEYPWQCTSQTPPNIPQPPYLIEVDQVYSCEDGGCVSSLANTYCTPLPGVQGVFEDEGGSDATIAVPRSRSGNRSILGRTACRSPCATRAPCR